MAGSSRCAELLCESIRLLSCVARDTSGPDCYRRVSGMGAKNLAAPELGWLGSYHNAAGSASRRNPWSVVTGHFQARR